MDHEEVRRQLREFNTIYKETDALYGELAKQSGLSNCAFWLMYSIREADGTCTQKELCDQWFMSKQTIHSALKGLEKDGYITLISSETDKRSKHIALTEKGIQLARESVDIVFELEQIAFQNMSAAQRTALLESTRMYQELFQAQTKRFLK